MFGLPAAVRIRLFTEPVDMRKGPDGLCRIVVEHGEDVFSGHLFVFLSRRRDRAKILCWDNGGFWVFYKRLEQGRFRRPKAGDDPSLMLDSAQLVMLLDGIDVSRVRRPNKWMPKNAKGIAKDSKP